MNGLMQKYKESLEKTSGPILLKDMPPMSIDYRGLVKYAEAKGVDPGSLSKEEKDQFCSFR